MTPNRPPGMPPVPRDHADLTFSEVVPFRSTKIRLLKSPLFVFFMILALVVPSLFALQTTTVMQESVEAMKEYFGYVTKLTIFTMLAAMLVGIYAYARPGRSIWTYIYAIPVLSALLLTPLGVVYFMIFRSMLPGDVENGATSFGQLFIKHFFGAGLMEELMKGTPVLIAAVVARTLLKRGTAGGPARGIALRGPLDGALMGMFAAAAFIYIETAFQYVPNEFDKYAKAGPLAGMTMALLLLVPRVLNGCVGHMAYSAVFGYFIGLTVIRPRQTWQLLAIGWFSASLLHGLWNSVGAISPLLQYVIAILSGIGAAAVLLKARQIQLAATGEPPESNGSILVDRRGAVPPVQPAVYPHPVAPAAAMPLAPAPPSERPLALLIEGFEIPLAAGATLDLGAEPALAGRGVGVSGAIVAHPSRQGVLGLRNTGTAGWTAILRDGSQPRIEPEQNVRLAPGVRIAFAAGLTADVVARG